MVLPTLLEVTQTIVRLAPVVPQPFQDPPGALANPQDLPPNRPPRYSNLTTQTGHSRFLGLTNPWKLQKDNLFHQETTYLYIPNAAVGAIIGKRRCTMHYSAKYGDAGGDDGEGNLSFSSNDGEKKNELLRPVFDISFLMFVIMTILMINEKVATIP